MIIGGGKAAYYLAKNLLDVGIDVKISSRAIRSGVRNYPFFFQKQLLSTVMEPIRNY